MNTKVLSSILFGFLALVLVVSSVSALSVSSASLSDTKKTATLDVTESGTAQNVTSFTVPSVAGITFAVSPLYLTNVNSTAKQVTITATTPSVLKFGTYTTTLTADGTSSDANATIAYTKGFCKAGEAGTKISINDFSISSTGDDDTTWNLLDEITVEVEVENNDDDNKVKDIMVNFALFDENGTDVSDDLDWVSSAENEVDLGSISDDSKETATFKFRIPADFEDGDYKLAFKAFSEDAGEANLCKDSHDELSDDNFEAISIEREGDEDSFITFDKILVTPEKATCGDNVAITFDMYNIGDTDLEDRVKVSLVNTELGINLFEEITKDFDMGDKAAVRFEFKIPANATNKKYALSLFSDYEYDSDDGTYDQQSKVTNVQYEIFGCNVAPVKNAEISAVLVSTEAVAGKDVVVKATIKNIGSVSADYVVSALDYDSWATLKDVSDRLINIAPGQSKDVTFTFALNKDAEGAKTFTIETVSAGVTSQRDAELTIQKSASWLDSLGGNSMLWIIGAVNLVLIVLIVIVAIKLTRN